MKMCMTDFIFHPNGQPIKKPDGAPADLRYVCVEALLGQRPDEKLTGIQKYEYFKLSEKLYKNDVPELSIEELAKLKTRIGDCPFFGAAVVGTAWDLLDPSSEPK